MEVWSDRGSMCKFRNAQRAFRNFLVDPLSLHTSMRLVGWLVGLRINVDLAIFQPYLDLEAGDNQSLEIQVARPGIEPRSFCSASQELNNSATAASYLYEKQTSRIQSLHLYFIKIVPFWLRNIRFLIQNTRSLFYGRHYSSLHRLMSLHGNWMSKFFLYIS